MHFIGARHLHKLGQRATRAPSCVSRRNYIILLPQIVHIRRIFHCFSVRDRQSYGITILHTFEIVADDRTILKVWRLWQKNTNTIKQVNIGLANLFLFICSSLKYFYEEQ